MIRDELGLQLFVDQTVPLGTWTYLAQVCDGTTLTAYRDGTAIGSVENCTPGVAAPYGLIIGANNTQNGNKDSELTGAISGLRIWTMPRTAAEICAASTRTDC